MASADTEGLVKSVWLFRSILLVCLLMVILFDTRVWSFAPIQTRATLQSKSQLLCLGWANRVDRLLLLGTSTGKLRLYDTEAKRTYCDVEADAEYPRVLSVSSSPNGQLLVYSCAADISRDIISLPTAKCYGDPLPEMHSPRRKRRPECTGALVCWDVKAMKTEVLMLMHWLGLWVCLSVCQSTNVCLSLPVCLLKGFPSLHSSLTNTSTFDPAKVTRC